MKPRFGCQDLGGYDSGGTPVPIPNTEVKPACADGIASRRCERVGSCQDFDIKNVDTSGMIGALEKKMSDFFSLYL